MNIEEYLKNKSTKIDHHLNTLITEEDIPQRSLYKAARYSLLAGGKRLRPVLAMATADAFGCPEEKAIDAACALEMIHTYSLIHDDLPCMDDDDLRRGKPTLHKAFPESHAVLAGDYLLTHSFEVIASDKFLSDLQKVNLIRLLASSAGGRGMIGGQIMDIEAEGTAIELSALEAIHSHKTGALIVASVEVGGIIAEVDAEQMDKLRQFGRDIGLAFQIIDDVLDVTATQENLGKTSASDLANNKSTYVSLMGIACAREKAEKLLLSAKKAISELPLQTSYLSDLADYVINRKH